MLLDKTPSRRLATLAWATLAYTVGVVLWGALVRATGSGAGCGSHWPRCNGEVIPLLSDTHTAIEFTHRLTSGAAGLLVVWLLVWTFRDLPRRHAARGGAVATFILMGVEALLGAGLVRLELVAENASLLRAFAMAAHLLNTFLLLGAMTLTAWWASGGAPLRLRGQGTLALLLGTAIGATLLVGVTGAIAALGDTLFPAASLAEGLRQDLSSTAHVLLRLRILHPFLAVATGLGIVLLTRRVRALRSDDLTHRFARALAILFVVQIVAGVVNMLLLVPIWMQLVHLLLADLLWISLILTAAAALADAPAPVRTRARPVGGAVPVTPSH